MRSNSPNLLAEKAERFPGRATQPRGSLQIGPTGSQEEPLNSVEAFKFAGVALRKSHSTQWRPSNRSDWLSGRATQLSGGLQIGPTGSQEEPLNSVEAFKFAGVALRKSHSTQWRPSNRSDWLSGRATEADLKVSQQSTGSRGEPVRVI
jgi:hypothetical protein